MIYSSVTRDSLHHNARRKECFRYASAVATFPAREGLSLNDLSVSPNKKSRVVGYAGRYGICPYRFQIKV